MIRRHGSSPLTRGKPSSRACATSAERLIPAHAGKTRHVAVMVSSRAAHPRSRGENGGDVSALAGFGGSSPLTRGKPHGTKPLAAHRRLIPAHAGKTQTRQRACHAPPAHPRSRGENVPAVAPLAGAVGSSPLTRGKHIGSQAEALDFRLIPAHAGKTLAGINHQPAPGAHPRSRGENLNGDREAATAWGSSPLTRGKLTNTRCRLASVRLIPAHAGKTARAGAIPS